MKEILNVIHKTIYQFFDVCDDDEEVPMSDKDKLLLEVNKAICNNLKALDMGEVSDGYHTFNQLYHQRAVLFATIVNQNKDKSWKSFKHSDGNYCFDSNGEWFIVGVDTPKGSYTYHYSKEYWNMFDCEELECGKEWDGHTEEDVTRLLSLEQDPCNDCISRQAAIDAIKKLHSIETEYDCTLYEKLDVLYELEDLPPVIPVEKQEPCEDAIKYFDTIHNLSQTCNLPYSFVKDEIEEIMKRLKGLDKQTFEGMTNGEVMQAVFPKAEVEIYIDEYERPSDYLMYIDDETYFTKEWWNAPYKGGAE